MSTRMAPAAGPKPIAMGHVLAAMLLLLACLGFTQSFATSKFRADEVGVPNFETLIPSSFGDWQATANGGGVVDPEQEAAVRKLYTTTLNRTYVHAQTGRRVMLSIGYGKDQSHVNQVHTPEQCYPSQGFIVDERILATLPSPVGQLPVVRMHTHRGLRVEPLTYWVLVGDEVVRGSLDVNLSRIRFAMRGQISDGLIFRVSEVAARNADSFEWQSRFLADLFSALPEDARGRIIGMWAD